MYLMERDMVKHGLKLPVVGMAGTGRHPQTITHSSGSKQELNPQSLLRRHFGTGPMPRIQIQVG